MKNLKMFEEFFWNKKINSNGADDNMIRNIMKRISSEFDIKKLKDIVVDYVHSYGEEDQQEIYSLSYNLDGDEIYSHKQKVFINGDQIDVSEDLAVEFESLLKKLEKNYKNKVIGDRYSDYRKKYNENPDRHSQDTSTFDNYKYRR